MKEQLKIVINNEKTALEKLLATLKEQHKHIISNDVFALDAVVEKIKASSIEVAKYETERRKLMGERTFQELIDGFKDKELEVLYNDTKKIIEEAQMQKESNELLIKQSLVFANKMLNFINPDRGTKTYNSYGKVYR